MEGDIYRAPGHFQLHRRVGHAGAAQPQFFHHLPLPSWQIAQQVAERHGKARLDRRHGTDVGEILQRQFTAATAAAGEINKLVADNRTQPRGKGMIGAPSVPLEVNGQKDFLKDVLYVGRLKAKAPQVEAGELPERRRYRLEQTDLGFARAGLRRPHVGRPLLFAILHVDNVTRAQLSSAILTLSSQGCEEGKKQPRRTKTIVERSGLHGHRIVIRTQQAAASPAGAHHALGQRACDDPHDRQRMEDLQ